MKVQQAIDQNESTASQTPAKTTTTDLMVTGMTCGNCARHVTEALQNVQGVGSASVSLDSRQASVRWKAGSTPNPAELIQAVENAGYEAKIRSNAGHDHAEHKVADWQINLWLGLAGMALLMAGEWIFQLGATPWFRWLSFGIATLVQIFAGGPFYRGAWNQLKRQSANMDTLVALGSSTAFVFSAWTLLTGSNGHLYFMEAAAIIALVSIGHWIEARMSLRASTALRNLLNLAPQRARRRTADGSESEVAVSELKPGDLVVLRPGDRVPTDGAVAEGDSSIDESMLTGESIPVDKRIGSPLYGGTLNLNGRLLMKVTATGEDTALARIISAVQRAQSSRANIQRLADRVSNIFVPIVIIIAVGAGLFWGLTPETARKAHTWLAQFLWPAHPPIGSLAAAFIISASVLIVACPCAMGLATPAALMAATNAAAQRGILIRDGVALEKAGAITAVVFDKTGTLTTGKPEAQMLWESKDAISNFGSAPTGRSDDPRKDVSETKALAAALAQFSNHPVSQAVARLSRNGVELVNWREIRGRGVEATWMSPDQQGSTVRLGSLAWLQEQGVLLENTAASLQEKSSEASSLVGVAVGQSLRGLFVVQDALKPSALKVVQRLQQNGFKVYMITGDNSRIAARIAEELRIAPENIFAEVRPEQKAELLKQLQAKGERVAFVGDGINDAPALEQADLGIAVSRASDIAREAADIILLNSEIEAVPESLGLARATLRTIKQNLFWAFFYNSVGIPLAALGFMSPVLCAAAMGLSDVVVIGNALRLRRWNLDR
jgi:Cu+-exporting ATPase